MKLTIKILALIILAFSITLAQQPNNDGIIEAKIYSNNDGLFGTVVYLTAQNDSAIVERLYPPDTSNQIVYNILLVNAGVNKIIFPDSGNDFSIKGGLTLKQFGAVGLLYVNKRWIRFSENEYNKTN
jgi:hypothetical protein